jgi:hypothetical protein
MHGAMVRGYAVNLLVFVLCCRVHFTPKLREHDVGVLTLNQVVLDIPPGKPSRGTQLVVGTC